MHPKRRCHPALTALALAGACVVISASAPAAVSAPPGESTSIAARTTKGVTGADAKPAAERGLTLRCWQFGRLILEEPVNANASGGAGGSMNFTRPGDNRPLEVFSMGEAVCVIR